MNSESQLAQDRHHPILRRDYILPTPPIEEVVVALNEVIQCGDTGVSFQGLSRSGKTWLTKFLDGEIIDYAGRPVPVFRVIASNAKVSSELRFYEEIYQDVFGTATRLSKASDYLNELKSLFICEARAACCQDAVLCIDQAGRWPWENFIWLSDLQNKISDIGVNLVMLLIGHRLTKVQRNLRHNDHSDVVARYLSPIYEFRSLKGVREIKTVLRLYDNKTEYPLGSGVSYTRYFLKDTELNVSAKLIWDTYQLHTRKKAGKTPKVWPTAYFTKTIEQLLIHCSRTRASKLGESSIMTALDKSRMELELITQGQQWKQ